MRADCGETGEQCALVSGNLLDGGVADAADADQVAGLGQFGGRAGDGGRGAGERLERGRAPRPQRHRIARVDDPARHRGTLAAQADEADTRQEGVLPSNGAHVDLMCSFISARRVRMGEPTATRSLSSYRIRSMPSPAWLLAILENNTLGWRK